MPEVDNSVGDLESDNASEWDLMSIGEGSLDDEWVKSEFGLSI
jgi:hypothetical protein